jgi:hypothetical protein
MPRPRHDTVGKLTLIIREKHILLVFDILDHHHTSMVRPVEVPRNNLFHGLIVSRPHPIRLGRSFLLLPAIIQSARQLLCKIHY